MNKIGVANRKGRKACFSFWYKPGATNLHIWIKKIGKETHKDIKKATLTCVKKPSCKAVNIILPPFSSIWEASGACKNI